MQRHPDHAPVVRRNALRSWRRRRRRGATLFSVTVRPATSARSNTSSHIRKRSRRFAAHPVPPASLAHAWTDPGSGSYWEDELRADPLTIHRSATLPDMSASIPMAARCSHLLHLATGVPASDRPRCVLSRIFPLKRTRGIAGHAEEAVWLSPGAHTWKAWGHANARMRRSSPRRAACARSSATRITSAIVDSIHVRRASGNV